MFGKRGPQKHLQVDNLLVGFTELTESYYPHSYGFLEGKDTDQTQPIEVMQREEPGRILNRRFPLSFPVESGCVTLPELTCNNTQR